MLLSLLFILWAFIGLVYVIYLGTCKHRFANRWYDWIITWPIASIIVIGLFAWDFICALIWIFSFGMIDLGDC